VNGDEAVVTLDQVHKHLYRLTMNVGRCGHPTVGASDIATQIAKVYRV
jgi:hypothetical protein